MAARRFRSVVLRAGVVLACLAVLPGVVVAAGAPNAKLENSSLDSQLFYQLLIGEIELRSGEAGTAYEVLLDAARRTRDEQLFRRVTDIAIEARAFEQALAAAKAWRSTVPASMQAHRYLIQLLVSLKRAGEAAEPLRSMLTLASPPERAALINSLPRFFSSNADRKQTATLIDQVLQPYLNAPDTQVLASVASGRAWYAAQENDKALDLVRRAQALDPSAESPAVLAVEMMATLEAAEDIVLTHLKAKPASHGVRLVYVRALAGGQRYADAVEQLGISTRNQPELAPPWLTLGALQLELKHPAEAAVALTRYVQLMESSGSGATPTTANADDDDTPPSAEQGLTQAWLLLAQASEQLGDFTAAESWLSKVESPQRVLEVQTRRAALLARQGKLNQARELIRRVPERTPDDARAKLLAEAQVLRDVKRWNDANTVLAQANLQFENDPDLLYEQSMTAEKLNRIDDMERLLRRVIALKPDHHHAYNALGYSLADRNVRLPEAKTLIQKALSLSPGEPFITDSLGWVEFRLGNREEALAGERIAGRLSVRVDGSDGAAPRALNSAFELEGNSSAGRLDLSTPLGTMLAQVLWAPGRAVLVTPQNSTPYADLDALTAQLLGESVPVAALFDWLRGRPWPEAPSTGNPASTEPGFVQLGWSVDLAGFAEAVVVARRERPPAVTVRAKLDRP